MGARESQRAEKYDTKKSKERRSSRRSLLFFVPYSSARLDFPSPPLSAPGSRRMEDFLFKEFSFLFILGELNKEKNRLF